MMLLQREHFNLYHYSLYKYQITKVEYFIENNGGQSFDALIRRSGSVIMELNISSFTSTFFCSLLVKAKSEHSFLLFKFSLLAKAKSHCCNAAPKLDTEFNLASSEKRYSFNRKSQKKRRASPWAGPLTFAIVKSELNYI